ncbi:MAG: hypothetical protein ACOY99_00335 [Pseudomonadota bacterium]
MRELLISSALIQLSLAVFLGWPLVAFHAGAKRVGPLKSARRLLQAHLDNVLMGLLQLAIAATHPAIPWGAGWLLIAGSWINPQLFLIQAIAPEKTLAQKGSRRLASISFALLTIAYPWLAWAWFPP